MSKRKIPLQGKGRQFRADLWMDEKITAGRWTHCGGKSSASPKTRTRAKPQNSRPNTSGSSTSSEKSAP